MKGKIDYYGHLYIKRDEERGYIPQQCPYSPIEDEERTQCGDWCPLFGGVVKTNEWNDNYITIITICQDRVLTFEDFTDGRK